MQDRTPIAPQDPANVRTIYEAYSNRVYQIDTWRHLQVVFIYTVIVPGLGYLSLGGVPDKAGPAAWGVATVAATLAGGLAAIFGSWSQKRILVLVTALHAIEMRRDFMPAYLTPKLAY